MIKSRTLFLLILLLFQAGNQLMAQCQEDIDEANKLYNEGIYRDAEKLILKTLENCQLSKTQENELLKLIASVYYEMDELELGDEFAEKFLKKNPYYRPSKKNDPVQFREAIGKLKSFPRLSFGLRGGVPFGYVNTLKIFPVLDSADYSQPYTIKPSFLVSLEILWNLNSFISLNIGAGLRVTKIQHQVPQYNQIYFNYEEINYTSNFPVVLQFSIPTGGSFSPALYAGGELEMFTSATYSYAYTGNADISRDFAFYLNRKRNNVVIDRAQRSKYRYAALGGVRLNYNHERFGFYLDFRYIKEFGLYNNPDFRYTDADLVLGNNYTLGDLKFDNLDISAGVLFHLAYKVKSKY
ncbi:MAG: hypothetical protein U0W24_26610 [Bacteroidales bacterium]